MNDLQNKRILLGLSGGIACFKAAELCRALVKAGAQVQVVMTEAATHFITPVTLQAATQLVSQGGAITIGGTVNGDGVAARSLDVDAGTGDVAIAKAIGATGFGEAYADVFAGDERWQGLNVAEGKRFEWEEKDIFCVPSAVVTVNSTLGSLSPGLMVMALSLRLGFRAA